MAVTTETSFHHRGSAASHGGFTIVELLVVVASIGLILSLLIYAVGAVRGDASRTSEMSAARSLGTAWNTYALDHRGRVLPGYVEGFKTRDEDGNIIDSQSDPIASMRWPLRLAPYVGNDFRALYSGPTARYLSELSVLPREDILYSVSVLPAFGLNSVFVGGDKNYLGFNDLALDTFGDFYVERLASIKRPDQLVVFATARCASSGPNGDGTISEGFFRVLPPLWVSPEWDDEYDPDDVNSAGFLSPRHRNGNDDVCIVTTADGGVSTETIESLRDMRKWYNDADHSLDVPEVRP